MLRQIVSKILIPTLERDLNKSIGAEMATASKMMDCMLAPTVHAYQTSMGGAFAKTASAQARNIKVAYPVPGKGLFQ